MEFPESRPSFAIDYIHSLKYFNDETGAILFVHWGDLETWTTSDAAQPKSRKQWSAVVRRRSGSVRVCRHRKRRGLSPPDESESAPLRPSEPLCVLRRWRPVLRFCATLLLPTSWTALVVPSPIYPLVNWKRDLMLFDCPQTERVIVKCFTDD